MSKTHRASVCLLLVANVMPAFALTYDDAAFNLPVFEKANSQAQFCERFGTGYLAKLKAWENVTMPIRAKTIQTIRLKAKAEGLSDSDQDKVVSGALEMVKSKVATELPNDTSACKNFDMYLAHYHSILKE